MCPHPAPGCIAPPAWGPTVTYLIPGSQNAFPKTEAGRLWSQVYWVLDMWVLGYKLSKGSGSCRPCGWGGAEGRWVGWEQAPPLCQPAARGGGGVRLWLPVWKRSSGVWAGPGFSMCCQGALSLGCRLWGPPGPGISEV